MIILWTLLWWAVLRVFVAQGLAHMSLCGIKRSIAQLPGDKTVIRSTGLQDRTLHLTPAGEMIATERLWWAVHVWSTRHRIHPHCAAREFLTIPIADATVHDVRSWLTCARHVWLSQFEVDLIHPVRLRVIDLRGFPDSANETARADDDPRESQWSSPS